MPNNKAFRLTHIALAVVLAVLIYLSVNNNHKQPARLSIALNPMGTTDEYFKAVHAGGARAAKELGVDLIWMGPARPGDRSSQIDVEESMIALGVSGIVLAPLDDMALRQPVESAYRYGIPVVIIDSALQSDHIRSFIATNNYKGGLLAGEHLAKLLKGKGKVALLRGVEGSASTDSRERGFLEAMKGYPGIQVVSSNQHGGGTSETAYKASENLLAPFKTGSGIALDGIFCPNESTTFGMLRALQDSGLAGKVAFVGFDSSAKLNQALGKGEIQALVVQNPVRMGYLGVKTVVEAIRGQTVAPQVEVEAAVITRETMLRPAERALLEPDLTILHE